MKDRRNIVFIVGAIAFIGAVWGSIAVDRAVGREQERIDKMMDAAQMRLEPTFDEEGFIDYRFGDQVYKLWYGKIDSGTNAPVLVLHGGPGGNHHNLVAFQALKLDRPVYFYDQLGCGKSDRPDDVSLWTADRYFDEVSAVRDGLGLTDYHLIGHSWGTTLAVGFAAKYPDGIRSVSLHSPVLSFSRYIDVVTPELKKNLGEPAVVIDKFELHREGSAEEYEAACMAFVKKHVTHTWPLPDAMKKLIAVRNAQIHDVMVDSGSELNVPGNLKSVDVILCLESIQTPILFTCGKDDLCTPEFTAWQAQKAQDSEVHIIEKSAHMTPIDNPEDLISIQRDFLARVEDQEVRQY